MGEEIFARLRDCFTAGYTFPQYCIDNGIKKPLFVSEKKFELLLWEIYVQFHYDKNLKAQFCFLDAEKAAISFKAHGGLIDALRIQNISAVNFDDFDKIIFLTTEKPADINKKNIPLNEVQRFFIRKAYCEIPLLNFLQRYPKVKLILTNFPPMSRYKDSLAFREQLKGLDQMRKILRTDKSGKVQTPLDKFGYTNAEVLELMEAPDVKTTPDGTAVMADDERPLTRVKNNKRMTAYQPETYQKKIYLVGSCHHEGINAPFDKTIASYLQKMLNDNRLPYRVENESQRYFNRYQDIFYTLNNLSPNPGDIILTWIADLRATNSVVPFIDVSNAFDPPNDYREIFCVRGHVNELGYKLVAEKYFDYLTTNNFFRDKEFNYPLPPPLRTATASRRNTNGEARLPSKMRSWTLTSRPFAKRNFKSVLSS